MTFYPGRTALPLLLTACLTLLAACASSTLKPTVDYNRDYNFSGIKTLAFAETTSSGDSVRAMLSDMEINRTNTALKSALEAKGFRIVEDQSEADALVNWHLVASEKQDIHTVTTPGVAVGYNRYNRGVLYDCWQCGTTEVFVYEYTEGTFIVDIVDPELKQSVWRSVTQSELTGKLKEDPANYTAAAEQIMSEFPPL